MAEAIDIATALNPRLSIIVEACAGSGKTWLLVSRMIRLLLAGAKPSELLAITFTNKAAQEMNSRLNEWLQILATADDHAVRQFLLDRKLAEADIDTLLPRARSLLEGVLTAQPGPTITTFHGWFLNLLRRAPLEAGLPWGAPLLERERQLREEVMERLLSKWAASPDSAEGRALVALLDDIGESNLQSLLSHFMQARAEWQAYGEGQADAVGSALAQLKTGMHDGLESDPVADFWLDDMMVTRARRVGQMLEKGTDAECRKGLAIQRAIDDHDIESLRKNMLKANGDRLASKATKGLLARLAADAESYLHDYETLETALENISAIHADQRIWNLNQHGLLLGHALLQEYQRAKADRGVIDFADAEWLGCKLLEDEEHAPALNLKLDARYRHLLLDEFQDTNPLQWRALSAWLTEALAADSGMTVFMVGDPKQAIYRFRRGEARVFNEAANFLEIYFKATRLANNQTRRLAPEVVKAVNPVFEGSEGFVAHEPLRENDKLPGAVRKVFVDAPGSDHAIEIHHLRNPLTTPMADGAEKAVHDEAREFARILKNDILGRWVIVEKDAQRSARYGDVMALVRKRTHLKIYEQALESAGIPFLTSRRGGLLHALEAQDIVALLETLLLPHADLKLAHVLKSPLMTCSDAELLQVFPLQGSHGWDCLADLVASGDCSPALARAYRLLSGWRAVAGRLPVHDLLDRIYFEGDVEARYAAAAPEAMRPQITANLRAFMQLALTQDAGRYPSLGRFIRELKLLVDDPDAAPEEGVAAEGENAVRLLTIHGAKGLEAPIVWLLGGTHHAMPSHHDVLAPWPPDALRPAHFSLYGKKEDRGEFRQAWFAEEEALNRQEDTNLLYVALTRAKQGLIVSGDAKRSNQNGEIRHPWLNLIEAAWQGIEFTPDLPVTPLPEDARQPAAAPLMTAIPVGVRETGSAQSQAGKTGEFFHACLEHHAPPGTSGNLSLIAKGLGLNEKGWRDIEQNAKALLTHPDLSRFFDPEQYLQARNELEILTAEGNRRIDRLVEFDQEIWILDYKTGEADARLEASALISRYGPQLNEYIRLASSLWPSKPVRAALVLSSGRFINPCKK